MHDVRLGRNVFVFDVAVLLFHAAEQLNDKVRLRIETKDEFSSYRYQPRTANFLCYYKFTTVTFQYLSVFEYLSI